FHQGTPVLAFVDREGRLAVVVGRAPRPPAAAVAVMVGQLREEALDRGGGVHLPALPTRGRSRPRSRAPLISSSIHAPPPRRFRAGATAAARYSARSSGAAKGLLPSTNKRRRTQATKPAGLSTPPFHAWASVSAIARSARGVIAQIASTQWTSTIGLPP